MFFSNLDFYHRLLSAFHNIHLADAADVALRKITALQGKMSAKAETENAAFLPTRAAECLIFSGSFRFGDVR